MLIFLCSLSNPETDKNKTDILLFLVWSFRKTVKQNKVLRQNICIILETCDNLDNK